MRVNELCVCVGVSDIYKAFAAKYVVWVSFNF